MITIQPRIQTNTIQNNTKPSFSPNFKGTCLQAALGDAFVPAVENVLAPATKAVTKAVKPENLGKVRLYFQKNDPSIPKEVADKTIEAIIKLKNGGLVGESALRELIVKSQDSSYELSSFAKIHLESVGLTSKKGQFRSKFIQQIASAAGKGNGLDFKFVNPLTGKALN